ARGDLQRRQRRAPLARRHRRGRRARGWRRAGRARALAARSRRHRHRVVLRRLVEGEADPGLGAAHLVRRGDSADGRVLPRPAAAVCAAGAIPVFVDVDPDTATIDEASAHAALTDRTRAVIPVHLYGRPAVLPNLRVPVVEDGAQAHGALDPHSGSATAAYSFYPTKNLGGVTDGGAVVTDDDELAATLRLLRAHGLTSDYVHTRVSTNARLSDIAAAALRVGLRRLSSHNDRRREIAA